MDWSPVIIAVVVGLTGTFGVEALRQMGVVRTTASANATTLEARKLDEAMQTRDRLWQRVTDLEAKIERMETAHASEVARLNALVDDYQSKYVETNAKLQVVLIEVEALRAQVKHGAGQP